jgi:hypothetical protein
MYSSFEGCIEEDSKVQCHSSQIRDSEVEFAWNRLASYGYVDASPETRHFEEDALLGKLQYVSHMFFNSLFVYDEDYLRI